jgi:hypothetical protein
MLVAIALLGLTCFGQKRLANVQSKAFATLLGTNDANCITENEPQGPVRHCSLVVEARTPEFQQPIRIDLPLEFAKVSSLSVSPHNRLVVIGEAPGGYDNFAIYDLSARQFLLVKFCYSPALSPDAQWIAYQRFIPPHGMEALSVDVRVIRVDARDTALGEHAISIYKGQGQWLMDELHWSIDGQQLLFGVASKTDSLILAHFPPPNETNLSPDVWVYHLHSASVCQDNSQINDGTNCQLRIEKINFAQNYSSALQVTFRRFGAKGYDYKTIDLTLSDFLPQIARRSRK